MMESNFRRRASGVKLGGGGVMTSCLSPKGTIKKSKQDRKAKEQHVQEINSLNVLIGRLEDRDTQRQAFAKLIESLPDLDPPLVKEVYGLIEKNKKPARASTRRMLVLLIAAICKCHPVQTAKFLPRVLAYVCLRLRDKQTKTTDACVILVSAIALYVLPCPSVSLPTDQTGSLRHVGANKIGQSFETVAALFAKEVSAVGEAATRCLCGLLHPIDFDGVSVPGPVTIRAHATRIRPFFKMLLADTVAKLNGSKMFASFGPPFLLLLSSTQLVNDANEKASYTALGDDFAPYISSIYEAIEDVFEFTSREDWVVRKRGLEILTVLLDTFVLQDLAWCTSVEVAKEYFESRLEKVRTLVLAGRHDSVSLVREAAISAVMAFECLEKQCPQTANGVYITESSSASYDFVLPNPQGYKFHEKRLAASGPRKTKISSENGSSSQSIPSFVEEDKLPEFSKFTAGDEALPIDSMAVGDNSTAALSSSKPTQVARVSSTSDVGAAPQTSDLTEDDEKFMDMVMDQAAAPENETEQDECVRLEDTRRGSDGDGKTKQAEIKWSDAWNVAPVAPSATTENKASRSSASLATAMQAASDVSQFVAKQRAKTRSRHTYQDIPQISLPKRKPSRRIDAPVVDKDNIRAVQPDCPSNQCDDVDHDNGLPTDDNSNGVSVGNLEMTRADAAFEAAQCGEFELAIRLCIVEDDLELLRRTLALLGPPIMTLLSVAARNALCTAFLSLLDGDASDVWLVLQWMQHWASEMGNSQQQFDELDSRVAQLLGERLHEMSMAPTKAALAAAHVMFLLGV